jgi:hypothetical protein
MFCDDDWSTVVKMSEMLQKSADLAPTITHAFCQDRRQRPHRILQILHGPANVCRDALIECDSCLRQFKYK